MSDRAKLLTSCRAAAALILRPPRDLSTEDGRSAERFRRAALAALASAAAKLVSMISIIVSVPLTLRYLGAERYGIWMTISSAIVMLSFADLGMGNGLMSAVSVAHGKQDRLAAQRSVSSGFFLLTCMSALLLSLFFAFYRHVHWQSLFNVQTPLAVRETGPAVAVLFTSFAVSMPLGVVQRTQIGYQQGFESSIWQCFGSIFGLAALLTAIHLGAGLPWLVLAVEGAPVLAMLLNGLVFFGFQKRWLLPSRRYWSIKAGQHVLQTGVLFFSLQLALSFAVTTDNIVAAHVIGDSAVAQYSVVARLFSVITIVSNMVINPLWPAYAEAIARGDSAWVRRVLARSVRLSVILTTIPAIGLTVLGGVILRHWVGTSVVAPLALLAGFGVWSVLGALGNTTAMFLNGAHVVKYQVIWTTIFAAVALAAKVASAHVFGISGIIWAMDGAYILLLAVPYLAYVVKYLRSPAPLLVATSSMD